MEARKVILYLSAKYEGDWEKIYAAVANKEDLPEESVMEAAINESLQGWDKVVTIVDDEYPEKVKNSLKPPFVLYLYGKTEWLKEKKNAITCVREPVQTAKELAIGLKEALKQEEPEKVLPMVTLGTGPIQDAMASAIETAGRETIIVSALNVRYFYPTQRKELIEKNKENILVISDSSTKTLTSERMAQRNRLMANLADRVTVLETNGKGGTMQLISYALNSNKDIYVAPTSLAVEQQGVLNNKLIGDGALILGHTK